MGKVRQLLFNLLDNACKFTHDGQIEFEARRDPQDGGDNMIFRVTDNGIGMNPEQQERIFEPFTQADESAARRYGGTGLGLTISREFSEFLGGWIEVSSEEGSGSTFTVTLPARVSRDGDQPR
jgi:signal transduction histidine kinase